MNLIDLDSLIQSSYELDPLPGSLIRLAGLVAQDSSDINEIERIVAHDPALTGRVLRAANSAANAAGSPITTARAALMRIGAGSLLALALGSRIGGRLQRDVPEYGMAAGQLWRHSVASALAAEVVGGACRAPLPPETATAALLHDLGKIVLCRSLTSPVRELLERAYEEGHHDLREAESEILGVHHGEIGGLIAQHWRLPDGIVMGVTHHHAPEVVDLPVAYGVQVADEIAKAVVAEAPVPVDALSRACYHLGLEPAALQRCAELVGQRLPAVVAAYG
jgi:HD-like signal output (HDOD) protein